MMIQIKRKKLNKLMRIIIYINKNNLIYIFKPIKHNGMD